MGGLAGGTIAAQSTRLELAPLRCCVRSPATVEMPANTEATWVNAHTMCGASACSEGKCAVSCLFSATMLMFHCPISWDPWEARQFSIDGLGLMRPGARSEYNFLMCRVSAVGARCPRRKQIYKERDLRWVTGSPPPSSLSLAYIPARGTVEELVNPVSTSPSICRRRIQLRSRTYQSSVPLQHRNAHADR